MEAVVYNQKGKESGKVSLPKELFGLNWNADLISQVVNSLTSAKRKPVAHAKNRGEVRGGGKKPWQQKGLGRARHGSIRSPIWKGGGVTHGPRKEKNYDRKVSKKEKAKALFTILSRKFKEDEILFVDSLAIAGGKTREGVATLKTLSGVKGFERLFSKKNNATLVLLSQKDKETERALQNLSNIEVLEARNTNPLALLEYKYVLIENPEAVLKTWQA